MNVLRPVKSAAAFAPVERNPGTRLTREWFEDVQVNLSAAERRAATLGTRRTVKKDYQAAWLVKALQCIDLTTLAGDDTPGRVRRLCAKARRPLRDDIVEALGLADAPPKVGAVCVYPAMVPPAVKALEGSGIPVASVATGFPAGLTPLPQRLAEIRYAVDEGAQEIDIVIHRAQVLTQDWAALYDEVAAMREHRRDTPATRPIHQRRDHRSDTPCRVSRRALCSRRASARHLATGLWPCICVCP